MFGRRASGAWVDMITTGYDDSRGIRFMGGEGFSFFPAGYECYEDIRTSDCFLGITGWDMPQSQFWFWGGINNMKISEHPSRPNACAMQRSNPTFLA